MSAIWAKTHTDSQNHYSPDMVSRMERNPGAEEIGAIVIYVRRANLRGLNPPPFRPSPRKCHSSAMKAAKNLET